MCKFDAESSEYDIFYFVGFHPVLNYRENGIHWFWNIIRLLYWDQKSCFDSYFDVFFNFSKASTDFSKSGRSNSNPWVVNPYEILTASIRGMGGYKGDGSWGNGTDQELVIVEHVTAGERVD
jgi:hypothetical protein